MKQKNGILNNYNLYSFSRYPIELTLNCHKQVTLNIYHKWLALTLNLKNISPSSCKSPRHNYTKITRHLPWTYPELRLIFVFTPSQIAYPKLNPTKVTLDLP